MQQKGPLSPAAATAVTLFAFVVYRILQEAGTDAVALWIWRCVLAVCIFSVLLSLRNVFRWRRLLRLMATPTGLYGRTSHPADADPEAMGLKTHPFQRAILIPSSG